MVQTMEAWIVADPDALADFYGQNFQARALPQTANLETVPKREIANALKNATQGASKGEYHKIQHIQRLLSSLNPDKVRKRCPSCAWLFEFMRALIGRI